MSQRIFKSNALTAITGWDRPLQRHFLVVTSAEDETVYSNLNEANPAMTILQIVERLMSFKMALPATLLADLRADREANDSDTVCDYGEVTAPPVVIPETIVLLSLPAAPDLEAVLGYDGLAAWVGFYWGGGDELYFDDGLMTATCLHHGWLAMRRHIAGLYAFAGHHFGNSEEEAREMMLIDRTNRRLYAGPWGDVKAFLRKLNPLGEMHIAAEQIQQIFAAIDAQSTASGPIDMEAINLLIAQEGLKVDALKRWLDEYAAEQMKDRCGQCGFPKVAGDARPCPICGQLQAAITAISERQQ